MFRRGGINIQPHIIYSCIRKNWAKAVEFALGRRRYVEADMIEYATLEGSVETLLMLVKRYIEQGGEDLDEYGYREYVKSDSAQEYKVKAFDYIDSVTSENVDGYRRSVEALWNNGYLNADDDANTAAVLGDVAFLGRATDEVSRRVQGFVAEFGSDEIYEELLNRGR